MPLYALADKLLHAEEAISGKIYACLECGQPLKVRKRLGRRHFYHLQTAPSCRLYSKSEDHVLAQKWLESLFPKKALQIERPFLEIGRIADAFLEEKKVVFEIQCSAIQIKEAQNRMRDYRSLGIEVIWLLDEKRYNRPQLRPEEKLLREEGAYFLAIRRKLAYDQWELLCNERRWKKGERLKIDLSHLELKSPIEHNLGFPPSLKTRKFLYYARGDLYEKAKLHPASTLFLTREEERWKEKPPPSFLQRTLKKILDFYSSFFS